MTLTVRLRVGIGMGAVVALGGFTALLAQWGLQASATSLERLGAAAEVRNVAGMIRREVSEIRRTEQAYVTGHDRALPAKVDKAIEDVSEHVEKLEKILDDKAQRDRAETAARKLKEWHTDFKEIVALSAQRGYAAEEGLLAQALAALTATEKNLDTLNDDRARIASLEARLWGMRANNRRERTEREKARASYEDWSRRFLERLAEARSDGSASQALRQNLEATWRTYQDTFKQILVLDGEIANHETHLATIAEELEKAVREVAETAQTALEKEQATILAQNQSTRFYVLVASVANIVLALVLGGYTIHDLNRRLRAIADGLTDGAEDLEAAAASVATSATRLADRTAQQASHLEETSASIEELTATTKQNADNAAQAATLAQKARRAAEQGNASMGELNGAMREIQESAARIAKIIEVIKEIAFQTNLLALNAAVEAARAGEHGRGFAVVAEEVRSLAQRAAASAKETSSIIGASVQTAEKGGRMVDGVVLAQRGIVDDVQSVARLMEEIAAASREQAEGVHQINQAVVTIDKLTQQNSSAAETGAAAAEELSGQATSVASVVQRLVELVQGEALRERPIAPKAGSRRRASPVAPVEPDAPRARRAGAREESSSFARPTPSGDVPSLTEEELKDF